jgi:hypothetical protein
MANLNTATEVRDEGNWVKDGWGSRITTESAMNSFVDTLITRANLQLQQRVGVAWYAASVGDAPWSTLLKAAEMHLAQMFLLEAAAGIAESGSDANPAPFLGTGEALRRVAADRRALFEEIVAETRSTARPGAHIPVARAMGTSAHIIARFDPNTGDPIS